MSKRLFAEFLGTFWLVFGGAAAPCLPPHFRARHRVLGVALAFGLTVLTMAYTVGGISGGHFNPAVSIGLFTAGKFDGKDLLPLHRHPSRRRNRASAVLYLIVSGKADFAGIGSFATNGYGDASPGKYRPRRGADHRSPADLHVPDDHPWLYPWTRAGWLCADRHRPGVDADPSDLDPGDQHLGQPGPFERARRCLSATRPYSSSGYSGWLRSSARRSPVSPTGRCLKTTNACRPKVRSGLDNDMHQIKLKERRLNPLSMRRALSVSRKSA